MASHSGPAIRRGLATLAAGLVLLAAASEAKAVYIGGLIGNTRPGVGNANYTINFAVLNPFMGTPNDTWRADPTGMLNVNGMFRPGIGSPALDTTAQYLYLYQVSNNSPAGGPTINFMSLTLPFDQNQRVITSWGFFGGLGFSDNNGVVNAMNSFGLDNVPFGDPAAINIGVTNPAVVMIGALGFPPTTDVVRVSAFMSRFDASWAAPHLALGETSTIFGFTTNAQPTPFTPSNAVVRGSDGSQPFGWVVTPLPEPGALGLLALGSALVAGWAARGRGSP
jgi:hypothetical protein